MARAKANRRKPEQRRRRKLPRVSWRSVGYMLTFCTTAAVLFYGAQFALNRPVRTIQVQAAFQRVTPVQIEQAVSSQLARGFLGANLSALSADVEALEWVDDCDIERNWPDALVLHINEQVAAARWGETGLLNRRGELFADRAPHLFPELPQLSGPVGSEQIVAERYLTLRGQLAGANLGLSLLKLDERGAWSFRLDNGIQVRLGRQDVDERLRRFFAVVMPALSSELGRVEHVDLRYTNGFAVGWRDTAAQDAYAEAYGESGSG